MTPRKSQLAELKKKLSLRNNIKRIRILASKKTAFMKNQTLFFFAFLPICKKKDAIAIGSAND